MSLKGFEYLLHTSKSTLESISDDRGLDSLEKDALDAAHKIINYLDSEDPSKIISLFLNSID